MRVVKLKSIVIKKIQTRRRRMKEYDPQYLENRDTISQKTEVKF